MSLTYTHHTRSQLTDIDIHHIWLITFNNISHFYCQSTNGWNPEFKKRELFHRCARFILVHDQSTLVAFAMYRKHLNVAYCYELQVLEQVRRRGVGTKLVQHIEEYATLNNLTEINLTVFTCMSVISPYTFPFLTSLQLMNRPYASTTLLALMS
jgi:ribosomal protein S18 acetylase RimI-like enzyme